MLISPVSDLREGLARRFKEPVSLVDRLHTHQEDYAHLFVSQPEVLPMCLDMPDWSRCDWPIAETDWLSRVDDRRSVNSTRCLHGPAMATARGPRGPEAGAS